MGKNPGGRGATDIPDIGAVSDEAMHQAQALAKLTRRRFRNFHVAVVATRDEATAILPSLKPFSIVVVASDLSNVLMTVPDVGTR